MSAWFGQAMGMLLAALGLLPLPDAAALGLAVALIAVTTLVLAVVLSIRPTAGRNTAHPLRAIDVSALLAQSDPDAAGHPRPRAPGAATAA